MSQTPIQLIVGLGNPGAKYATTRHNVGAWLVEALASGAEHSLHLETKFKGLAARIKLNAHDCHLFLPTTFMNHSGQAIGAFARFYEIPPEAIVVAHDDLDLPAGIARLKKDGGHGGHNGLRDIIQHIHSRDFYRIRLGIGHPGHANDVVNYVLHRPNRSDENKIQEAISEAIRVLPRLLSGDFAGAMQQLHSTERK